MRLVSCHRSICYPLSKAAIVVKTCYYVAVDADYNDPECESNSTTSEGLEKREDIRGNEKPNECPRSGLHRITHSLPIDLPELPKNLGELVERALLNLKDNDKDK